MKRFMFSVVLLLSCALILPASIFAQETIKIGFFAPLTGFAAADGTSAKQAVDLAVKAVNASGGVLGKQIELVSYDDRHDSKEAVAVANKLIEKDQVVAVASGSYSMPTRVTAPIFQRAGIPMVAGYAVHPDVTKAGDFIFRVGYLAEVEGGAAADVAVKLLNAKKLAVLTMDNDFGRSLAVAFKKRAEQLGAEIVSDNIYALGEKDFTPLLTKVKDANPELLYTSGYYNEAALISKQAKDLGLEAQILGEEGFDSPKFIELAGDAANGVVFTTNLNREDPRPFVQEFLKQYREAYGIEPDMVGASSYDAFMVVVEGIKQAGSTDAQAIRTAIANLKDYDGVTGKVSSFNAIGEVMKPVQVQIVKDGEFKHFGEIDDPEVITPPAE
ncbi:extracellular ligand-binding receptor [Candidatus Vecturithrix granuli]|uniref:Extracellular ligand-binding receptor n=1 Tax=Vecturithrix granuli TaxID=1499967 RepID=A0A081C9M0_VECG1|nr:extracellular ligand-binding receptor [Candidatus Vecturithrix granuli]